MNKYELALILKPNMEESDLAKEIEKVKTVITKKGGNVLEVDEWGKKKLAYEIQKYTDGYYYFISFESETDSPAGIEEEMRLNESLLRFLVVKTEE